MNWNLTATTKPAPDTKVLAAYKNSNGLWRRIIAKWIPRFTVEANLDIDDGVDEYCEDKDQHFLIEGWYECIDNWDAYSLVYVHHEVTHWMVLPDHPCVALPGPPL